MSSHICYTTTQKFAGIYTEDTCAERWKLHHYLAHHRVFQTNSSHEANDGELEAVISLDQGAPSKILTEHEKYKEAFQISLSLAQQLSSLILRRD